MAKAVVCRQLVVCCCLFSKSFISSFLFFLVIDDHSPDSWRKLSSVFCTCGYIVSKSHFKSRLSVLYHVKHLLCAQLLFYYILPAFSQICLHFLL